MRRPALLFCPRLAVWGVLLFTPACGVTRVTLDAGADQSERDDAQIGTDASDDDADDGAASDAAETEEDAEAGEGPEADAGLDGSAGPMDANTDASQLGLEGDAGDAGSRGNAAAPRAVDVLFMIDNSGSMTQEQTKLVQVIDEFLAVLATGKLDPARDNPDVAPARSLHVGVISSDMGVNGAPPQKSCGALSFVPTERNTPGTQEFRVKPLGDDGVLQTSTAVAVDGVWASLMPSTELPQQIVAGDPACASVTLPEGQRFVAFGPDDPVDERAKQFRCIARLGKNGCGLEQQLEAVLKAVTPIDSPIKFSASASNGVPSSGHGDALVQGHSGGPNAGFLRPESVLVVVILSDEEDCSAPDASRALFDANSTAVAGEINVRCGLSDNQNLLFPIARYVDGLRALKPAAYQDRIIVASIVGVPLKENLGGGGAVSGSAPIQAVLDRDDMQFKVQRNAANTADEPVPTCISPAGDGNAAPGRRFLALTKAFGDNGVVGSICEPTYAPLLSVVADRVAAQLAGP